jgi:hypothetical protein
MVTRFRFADPELSGEFELPELPWYERRASRECPSVRAAWVRTSADGGTIAAQAWHGVGVWQRADGRLGWWRHPAAGHPLRSGETLLVSEYHHHRLVRYAWPQMRVLDEVAYPRAAWQHGGEVEELIMSPSQRLVVGWFTDGQGSSGYQVFSLEGPLRALSHRGPDADPCTLEPMHAGPVVSPQERLVVCAPGSRSGGWLWWQPEGEEWPVDWAEDDALVPSRGGVATFSELVVHDIARDTATTHLLQVDLEPGWVPDDPWDPRWRYGASGLEFLAEDRLRIRLPDDTPVELRLPLPAAVRLPTPARALPHQGDRP